MSFEKSFFRVREFGRKYASYLGQFGVKMYGAICVRLILMVQAIVQRGYPVLLAVM